LDALPIDRNEPEVAPLNWPTFNVHGTESALAFCAIIGLLIVAFELKFTRFEQRILKASFACKRQKVALLVSLVQSSRDYLRGKKKGRALSFPICHFVLSTSSLDLSG
jgi:hypothetical protein